MEKEAITFLGVGDVLIDREQPETIFKYVADVLRSGDITFANCEQMYSDKGYPNMIHASFSDPRNIPALFYAGIDLVSLANNHTLDWGTEGLLDTMSRLKDAGMPYVGVGKNLIDAAVNWASKNGYPGIMLETQDTNVPACLFYQNYGFILGGADKMLYRGVGNLNETALFWYFIF